MPFLSTLRAGALALAGTATALAPAPAAANMTEFDQLIIGLAFAGIAAGALDGLGDDDDRASRDRYDHGKAPARYDAGRHPAPIIEPPRGHDRGAHTPTHHRYDKRPQDRYERYGRYERHDRYRHHDRYERPRHDRGHDRGRGYGDGSRVLPAACIRDLYGYAGPRRVVGGPCLNRRDVRAVLPGACRQRIHVGGQARTAYGVRCLRQYGYRFR